MYVQHLWLRSFRNFDEADLTLTPGISVFVGANGQGKTNLVEALYLCAFGRSHRISTNASLIQKDAERGVIRATIVAADRALTCEWELNRTGQDRLQINGNPAKPIDFARALSVVMFAPEDIMIVRGDPSVRRAYIDDVATSLIPRLRGVISDYERTLKQRNSLLKSHRSARGGNVDLTTLDIWDDSLARLGSEIYTARVYTLDLLRPFVEKRYATIAGPGHGPTLSLVSNVLDQDQAPDEYAAQLAHKLSESRHDDIDRGQTNHGPHRDEVALELNGLPTKGYASHGETWSFVLSLRLAELDVKRSQGPHGDPIVILDDVFAELDATRRALLAASVSDVEQVLVTSAVKADVPEELDATLTFIKRGHVVSEEDYSHER